MGRKLIIRIAASLLLARWRQTLVATVGVTFSIAMFIALLGFMTGLNILLDGLILNRTPHIRMFNEIEPTSIQPLALVPEFRNSYHFIRSLRAGTARTEIYNSSAVAERLAEDPRVLGVAPKLTTQVFFREGDLDIAGIIQGVDAAAETRLFNLNDYVIQGDPADLMVVTNSIILGKALAAQLMADPGDLIRVTTVNGESFQLKVIGYFQSGLNEIDKTQSYASIATVQKLLGKPRNYITDIQVKLHDIGQAPELSREYGRLFGLHAEDIQTANAQFETGSFVRSLISYAVGITLLIVAGFGIYNILNMLIYEKMDTIAILKATGFSGKDVKRIFLAIAMTIGISGGISGLLAGFLISKGIDQVPFETEALPTVRTYPVNYDPVYYIIGILFALGTTFVAGYFPARKASRVDPIVIIRGK